MDYPILGIKIHGQGDIVDNAPKWAIDEDNFLNAYIVEFSGEFYPMPLMPNTATEISKDIYLYAEDEISASDAIFLADALQEDNDNKIREIFGKGE